MRTSIVEEELEDFEPYLYGRFSAPLRTLLIAQHVLLCKPAIRLNAVGLLKKLLVYTEDES